MRRVVGMKLCFAFVFLVIALAGEAAKPADAAISAALEKAETFAAREQWRDALKAGERLRTLCHRRHGGEHPDTALAELFLGEVHDHLGDRTLAEAHFRRALSIQQKVLSRDAPELVTTLTRLGAALKEGKRYDEAAGLLQQAFDLQAKISGANDEATAVCAINLARVLRSKGDVARAAGWLERAVAIRRALGGSTPGTIAGLQELAQLREAAGEIAAAEQATAERVVAVEARLGAQSPDLLAALLDWGRQAEMQQKLEAAEARYRRALGIAESPGFDDTAALARTLDALGYCLRQLDRLVEARRLLERAVELRLLTRGPADPETASSARHLGGVLRLERNFDAALPRFEQALAIRERVLGPKDPLTIESLGELGDIFWLRGAHDQAAHFHETRRYRAEELFGPGSAETAAAWHSLAIVYESAKRWTQATQAALRSLELNERLHGPADERTLGEITLLARVCTAAEAFEPALAQFARLAAWFRRHPEAGAQARAELLRQYAITAHRAGRADEAGALFRESRRAHETGLGARDPATLRSIADLWTFYDETRQPALALEVARELASRTETALGADAPATSEVFDRLAQLCLTLGDEAGAMKHFRRALDGRRRHFGDGSPEVLDALEKAGLWFEQAHDFATAVALWTERFGAVRRKFGAAARETAAACGDVAMCYFRQRDFRSARGMFESQLDLVAKSAGAESAEAMAAIARLGDVALAAGDLPGAVLERERLAAGCAKLFGADHVETARALLLLGEARVASGLNSRAAKALTDARRLLASADPPQPGLVSRAACGLARVSLSRGDREGAKRWALDALARPFGGEESLAESFALLGGELERAGDDPTAESVFTASLMILGHVAGDSDEHALAVLKRLAILRLRLGRPKAAGLLERALIASEAVQGAGSPGTADVLGWLAIARMRESGPAAAQVAAERMWKALRDVHGDTHPTTRLARELSAWTSLGAGKLASLDVLAERWCWAEPAAAVVVGVVEAAAASR